MSIQLFFAAAAPKIRSALQSHLSTTHHISSQFNVRTNQHLSTLRAPPTRFTLPSIKTTGSHTPPFL